METINNTLLKDVIFLTVSPDANCIKINNLHNLQKGKRLLSRKKTKRV